MTDDGKHRALIPVPENDQARPFVLAWVEKTAVDKLTSSDMSFSEAVAGLEAKPLLESESTETTGGPPEAGDTTITF